MGKIDEQKEYIGALKVYLGFILAIILSVGTGVSKFYQAGDIGILFWIGIFMLSLAIIIFGFIARLMHKNIKKLKDL